ncbi:MAG: prohibitin family protein [Planctomycetaceae bacterium]|jgi:regulator of protease activity HflC (stomatin/prohibitin superfamily)|nr:prohibitin family protein [Planctomycetaceae bacterium]
MAKNMKSNNVPPAAAAAGTITAVLVIAALLMSVRTVDVGHIGIVTSFGKIVGDTLDPGLHLIWPWRKVVSIDCRILRTEEKTQCYSQDLQLVEADITILTVLTPQNAVAVYENIGMQYLEQVKPRVFEILKQHLAKYEAEKLVENREKLRDEVFKACQERLHEIVDIRDIVISNFDFSDEYEQAIERKQVALQDSLRAENELKKAKIEAEQAIETAKGEAEAIRVRGQALQESPNVAQLEVIKKWDGKAPQTVVLQGSETNNIPVLLPIR